MVEIGSGFQSQIARPDRHTHTHTRTHAHTRAQTGTLTENKGDLARPPDTCQMTRSQRQVQFEPYLRDSQITADL